MDERMSALEPTPFTSEATAVPLCNSQDLADSGEAVPFDVAYQGQTLRGFAIRFEGQAHAYLNRCAHIPMEMDYQPNRFFDHSGQWLMCATHGAMYHPATGECVGGPCRGGLVKVATHEERGVVHWISDDNFRIVNF
jgi:nitrite reductase/ring-hydroxylating ferredoxin subunit